MTPEDWHQRARVATGIDPRSPKTPSKRVRDSEARKIAAGGRRMPDGILPANAAAALDALLGAGYATSANAVIARALEDAAKRAKVRS